MQCVPRSSGHAQCTTMQHPSSVLLVVIQDSIWTPVEAMRCYVRCSSSALQLSAPQGPGRMLMMDQLAADMQDRAMLEESHYAYTGIRTAYHQAFVPQTRQGTTAY